MLLFRTKGLRICSVRTRELDRSRCTIELDEPELIGVDDLVLEVLGGEFEDRGVVAEERQGRGDAKEGD